MQVLRCFPQQSITLSALSAAIRETGTEIPAADDPASDGVKTGGVRDIYAVCGVLRTFGIRGSVSWKSDDSYRYRYRFVSKFTASYP